MRYVAVAMQLQLPFPIHPDVERLYLERAQLQLAHIATSTQTGYAFDWRKFSAWCILMQRECLPATAETLSLYVTDLLGQGKKVVTVRRYAAGVAFAHRKGGLDSPYTQAVKDLLWGAQRVRCERPRQMQPLTLDQLRQVAAVLAIEGTPVAIRDRALVMIGFASALRRSNLAWMNLEDLRSCAQGLTIQVRREKQDKESRGRLIGIPFGKDAQACPVKCLDAWLGHRGRQDGPVFTRLDPGRRSVTEGLSMNAIGKIIKGAIGKIGISPLDYGPHSLRAGFITEAGEAGVNHLVIAAHVGQRSLETLKRYFRPADVFRANAFAALDV